jgi:sigma-B regulation protein RsbU (phosphoserine phosphatase)
MRSAILSLQRRLHQWGLDPRSGLARFTLWMFAAYALLWGFEHSLSRTSRVRETISGWTSLFGFVFLACALWLLIRWVRQRLLWRLRNRLIVTYVFIGVIPVVLIVTMVAIAGYLIGNQLTTMLVHKDLNSEVRSVHTLSSLASLEIANHIQKREPGALRIETLTPGGPQARFTGLMLAAWLNGSPLPVEGAATPPPELQDRNRDYNGLISWKESFVVRSLTRRPTASGPLEVLVVVPVTNQLLLTAVPDLGEVSLYSLRVRQGGEKANVSVNTGSDKDKDRVDYVPSNTPAVRAGMVPPETFRIDPVLEFGSGFPTRSWDDGKELVALIRVQTRISVLFQRLFTDLGVTGSAILVVLALVAVLFALIELVALVIGVRLTRTITKSIAQLYAATQHINRGDLRHRIEVRSNDQLASLEKSFNSMTESLGRLLEEQKEKERLQNELEIAQEVQAQLFPHDLRTLETLELHGVCKPARTVSGDYYDFVNFGDERLGIAVGDISGKGISAALLMATIHSAVRVFELGSMPEVNELVVAGAAAVGSLHRPRSSTRGAGLVQDVQSPAELLALLNRHLYHSTPPEKYATLFLAMYDGRSRSLTYSNGGHLPPYLIHDSGNLRKLDAGGLVIGLFPEITLEEEEVRLMPGDIFLAFSDGVTEPENDFGEFGEDRLLELVRGNRHLPLARISEIVTSAVEDWIGDKEQPDDITLVLARVQ